MGYMYYIAGVRNYLPSNKRTRDLDNIFSSNIGLVIEKGKGKAFFDSVQAIIDKHNAATKTKSAHLEVKINKDMNDCFIHILGKGYIHEILIHLKVIKGCWCEEEV